MKIDKICIGCMREKGNGDQICRHCGFDQSQYKIPTRALRPYCVLNGKYLLGRVLGEGGFGIVYIALNLNLNLVVAIKELFPSDLVDRQLSNLTLRDTTTSDHGQELLTQLKERFVREARSVAKLQEDNRAGVVNVLDLFEENNTAYMVMEYLDGQSLKQCVEENGPFEFHQFSELMKPVMASMIRIHSLGVIHRDISPDNLMLLKDGTVKLLDFGGVKDIFNQSGKSKFVQVKKGYTPAEQYSSTGKVGTWTDVYSFCATMYYCLTGVVPPEPMDIDEDGITPPSKLGVRIPKKAEQAILDGLQIRYTKRTQSIDELYKEVYQEEPPVNVTQSGFNVQPRDRDYKRKNDSQPVFGGERGDSPSLRNRVVSSNPSRKKQSSRLMIGGPDSRDRKKGAIVGTAVALAFVLAGFILFNSGVFSMNKTRNSVNTPETEHMVKQTGVEEIGKATEAIKITEKQTEAAEEETEAVAKTETIVEETEAAVVETETIVEETEETEAAVVETETIVEETEAVVEQTETLPVRQTEVEIETEELLPLDETHGSYLVNSDGAILTLDSGGQITLPKYAIVFVNQTLDDGIMHISYNGYLGTVSADQLVLLTDEDISIDSDSICYATSPIGSSESIPVYAAHEDSSEILIELEYGDQVEVEKVQDGWVKVTVKETDGWIKADRIAVYSDYVYYYAIADAGLNIRENPGSDSPAVGMIYLGNTVKVEALRDGWGKITYKDVTGWVSMKYMVPCKDADGGKQYETEAQTAASVYSGSSYTPAPYNPPSTSSSSSGGVRISGW